MCALSVWFESWCCLLPRPNIAVRLPLLLARSAQDITPAAAPQRHHCAHRQVTGARRAGCLFHAAPLGSYCTCRLRQQESNACWCMLAALPSWCAEPTPAASCSLQFARCCDTCTTADALAACLHARLPACLPVCVPVLPACLPARLPACMCACVPACVPACPQAAHAQSVCGDQQPGAHHVLRAAAGPGCGGTGGLQMAAPG